MTDTKNKQGVTSFTNGIYKLYSKEKLALDGRKSGDDYKAFVLEDNDGQNQQWTFRDLDGGYPSIRQEVTGKRLDAHNDGKVYLRSKNDSSHQQWILHNQGNGTFMLHQKASGTEKALTVVDGKKLELLPTKKNNPAQQWTIEALSHKGYAANLMHHSLDGLEAWQRFSTIDAMVDFVSLTGDEEYKDHITHLASHRKGLSSNDDDLWAAIADFKIYRQFNIPENLNKAKFEFEKIVQGNYWNNHCGGGVTMNYNPQGSKTAITNELFFYLCTLLYNELGNTEYLDYAIKTWKWINSSRLLKEITDGSRTITLICDHVTRDCVAEDKQYFTYNQGVILGGLANLYLVDQESLSDAGGVAKKEYLLMAMQIAYSVISSENNEQKYQLVSKEGILKEYDDKITNNRPTFKGAFMRHLAYLCSVMDAGKEKDTFVQFIYKNANAVVQRRSKSDSQYGIYWHKDIENKDEEVTTASNFAALDLFNAVLSVDSDKPALQWI